MAGTSTRGMLSASASSQAWSPPAPPKATSAKSRGSYPRSIETTRMAFSMVAFTTRITPAGKLLRATISICCASSHSRDEAASAIEIKGEISTEEAVRLQAPKKQIRIRHSRLNAAPIADRTGVGSGRFWPHAQRSAGVEACDGTASSAHGVDVEHRARPRGVRPLPPGSGRTSPSTSATSVDVPPMSNVMIRSIPLRRAIAAAPTMPPAGPDSTVRTGSRAAVARAVIPPLDCITKMDDFRSPAIRSRDLSRYCFMVGCRYALTATVLIRSYSRNSGRISCDTDSGTPSLFSAAATAFSFSGLAKENSSHTAIAAGARCQAPPPCRRVP